MSETTEKRSVLEEAALDIKHRSVGDGTIISIVGSIVDVKFDDDVPAIYNALTVKGETPIGAINLTLEVESLLPGNVVRCVAMASTDGLQRGLRVHDTGAPMMMPVGPQTLGRVWNVAGKPVDGMPMPDNMQLYPIHRPAPQFEDITTQTEIFETGIKAVDHGSCACGVPWGFVCPRSVSC